MATINNNKPSTWVTIPDATNKAIQSASSKTKDPQPVKNKLLWGIGFVVMVVAATVLLAPREMKNLLQGNLFESASTTDQALDDNRFVVGKLDFIPAKTADKKQGTDSIVSVSAPVAVTGTEAGTETATGTGNVVQAETAPVAIQVDAIDVTAKTETKTETTPDAASVAQIADLQKQLQDAQKQHEADEAKIKDLTAQVAQAAHPAAEQPAVNAVTPVVSAQVPNSIQSTSVLGQKDQLQPRYRVNTHTVGSTPQVALQQNAAGALSAIQQKAVQTTVKVAKTTPQSGPSEMVLIAFMLTFLGLMGWKTVKVMMG
ncbi:hypothetical protein HZA43_00840 [Candidatus Peregrinibacteria bacterium]|nr:hypothetical protein [Candidatus Peregrinibacteria bacterium]